MRSREMNKDRLPVVAAAIALGWTALARAGETLQFVEAIKDGDGGAAVKNHVGATSAHGNYVYASIVYEGKILIFKRDLATGALTYLDQCLWGGQHDVVGEMVWVGDRLYFMVQMLYAFAPDGKTGYFASGGESSGNVVGYFTRDPKTGRLAFGGVVKETRGSGPCALWADCENGFVYSGGWARRELDVMRITRRPPGP
jgi:6-phosphogluconolactonase (cycloisomerase 2 family)